jgi:hypothetical protein
LNFSKPFPSFQNIPKKNFLWTLVNFETETFDKFSSVSHQNLLESKMNENILENPKKKYFDQQRMELPGIDPGTSHMLSERSTI